jgi:putative transposase
MKRTKFTDQQIAFALRQAETGTRVNEVCRKMGISEATFYNWKKKYGGLGVSEVRRLKQLEDENDRLKRMVADLSLDKQMLQDVLQKKL